MSAKGVIFHEYGDSSKLKIEDVPIEEPTKGHVRVKMMAVGLNRAEVVFVEGKFTEQPKDLRKGSSLGYEGAGIVDKVGEGVKKFKVGDRVAVLCNVLMSEYPTNMEECIFPEYALVKMLDGQSFQDAASTWLAYLTAYFALVTNAKLKKGDWAVITAAGSSAGLAAVQMAKYLGANVIATSRTSSKRDLLMKFGADRFIATNEEDIKEKILEYTGGKGAHLIYDSVGGDWLEKLADATAVRGIIIEYGKPGPKPMILPYYQCFSKFLTFKVYFMAEYTTLPDCLEEAVQFINKLLPKTQSIVGKTFKGIEQLPEGHKFLEGNNVFGKAVVEFSDCGKTSMPSQ
ncbi:hypothetical protein PPL_00383 [Heterostelium album PN500]|uniref:Enoyl reductase (ER) domain-containing protein n=1 Tax=Heterostelium pallidum (strain ATCC 26659 / Pp 5 / PN500) TaxID=670386 RepID=D3AWA9_HETP5|nr:hypothetical protein PPL_00383 [Heterostelium album PN500]EFA86582.1 hypothetical protein PPL_00383 [Heterostelium album PN500]|eukprot:XP_020438687.1 hypothetical protein PPL_00383 [Heterostelium album PN500]